MTLRAIHYRPDKDGYNDFSQAQKLYGLWEWSLSGECPSGFDNGFLRSLIDSYAEYDSLTPRQEQALDNIISRFEVDENWIIEIDDD